MLVVFTAGDWPSQYRQAWQDAARTLRERGVRIISYGIRPGAQREQLESIAFSPDNVYLLDSYSIPRSTHAGLKRKWYKYNLEVIYRVIPNIAFLKSFNVVIIKQS